MIYTYSISSFSQFPPDPGGDPGQLPIPGYIIAVILGVLYGIRKISNKNKF